MSEQKVLLLDSNFLVALLIAGHADHFIAKDRLFLALIDDAEVLLPEEVCATFIRLAGNPKIFPELGQGPALELLQGFLRSQVPAIIYPTQERLMRAIDFLDRIVYKPNDVPDAFLAALAIENDATLVTFDRGFARFAGLKTEILTGAS